MFSVGCHVGRLLEVRVASPFPATEAARFITEISGVIAAAPAHIVAVCDLRGTRRIVDPETIDRIALLMRAENPKLDRNGLLLPDGVATVALQIERLIRSAGASTRRTFRRRVEVESWLNELLGADERARLAAFLDEPTG